jgi:hypothetical protein
LKTVAHLRDRFGVDPILRVLGISRELDTYLAERGVALLRPGSRDAGLVLRPRARRRRQATTGHGGARGASPRSSSRRRSRPDIGVIGGEAVTWGATSDSAELTKPTTRKETAHVPTSVTSPPLLPGGH